MIIHIKNIFFLFLLFVSSCSLDKDEQSHNTNEKNNPIETKETLGKKEYYSEQENRDFSRFYVKITNDIRHNPIIKNISKKKHTFVWY